jgi:hypothetical protein
VIPKFIAGCQNAFTAAAFESGPTSLLGLAHKEDTLRCLLAQPDLDLSVVTKTASRRWASQFTTGPGMQPRLRFVDLVVEEVRMLGVVRAARLEVCLMRCFQVVVREPVYVPA